MLAAYDGTVFAGTVSLHGKTYTAHDAKGRLLGRYASQREAVRAIPITDINNPEEGHKAALAR